MLLFDLSLHFCYVKNGRVILCLLTSVFLLCVGYPFARSFGTRFFSWKLNTWSGVFNLCLPSKVGSHKIKMSRGPELSAPAFESHLEQTRRRYGHQVSTFPNLVISLLIFFISYLADFYGVFSRHFCSVCVYDFKQSLTQVTYLGHGVEGCRELFR